MATLAKLIVKLVTDVSEFESGMKAANTKLTKIGSEMSQVGKTLTMGVTLPLVAAGTAAVKFASDLNESMNKVNVVFEKNGADMIKWSENSATAFGLSQAEALDAAGGFGAMFKTMGITSDKTMEMSKNLVQMAADMGSLYNVDPSQMLEKLRSGMAGEAEPLRMYGIMITEAAVKSKALEMGLGGATGALTEQEKALARYALIVDQAKVSQGDFANTSDGLANSTRILTAQLKDVAAKFGQELLPIVTDLLKQLIPLLKWFNDLPVPVKRGIIVVAGLAAVLGPMLMIGGQIITTFGAVAGLFGTGGALAGAGAWITATLIPALTGIVTSAGGVGTALAGISLTALGPIALLVAAIGVLTWVVINLGPAAWDTIQTIGKLFELLPKIIENSLAQTGPAISQSLSSALQAVIDWSSSFYRAGQALMAGFVSGIVSWATDLYQTVADIVINVMDIVRQMLGIHSPSSVFAGFGQNMMLGMQAGIDDFSAKPIQATVDATNAVLPASQAVKSGGKTVLLQIPQITINGELTPGQMKSLEERVRGIFSTSFVAALGD